MAEISDCKDYGTCRLFPTLGHARATLTSSGEVRWHEESGSGVRVSQWWLEVARSCSAVRGGEKNEKEGKKKKEREKGEEGAKSQGLSWGKER